MSADEAGADGLAVWVRAAQAGQEEAFAKIVGHFGRRVLGYCRRLTCAAEEAEDLAQEVFVKLYLALPTLDSSRALAPFLFRTAHNHCIDWLRRQRLPIAVFAPHDDDGLAAAIDPPDDRATPEEGLLQDELHAAVEAGLAELPIEYRATLLLRHREGLAYEDIAATLQIPLATVKSRLHRGRERLKQKLQSYVELSGRQT
ncbi:MAG: sigma-70 family RNA polymerase sigma factor [Vicinamibacteria bacterium]|jgi:RNA polymerase sigma-70 factor (ECF subfamily)|nr:sigma-70 family RNA polymerase sigma factor [Vicinamibacteria bacterium]